MRIHNVAALVIGSALVNVAVAACYSQKGGGGTSNALADGAPVVVDKPCSINTGLKSVATFAGATQEELMSVAAFMYRDDAPTKRTQLLTELDGASVTIQGDCGWLIDDFNPNNAVHVVFMKP